MCIIAGYNGTKRAAPLIIEMLRKTEGIDAGCYTGIATLHEGKIHYRKLAGNLDRLLAETDCLDLPGNIGIIHSRTPGGSWDSWAHPFTHEKDGEVLTALIANGTTGCCNERNHTEIPPKIKEILAAGYELKSAVKAEPGIKHPELHDGNYLYHKTDIVAQNVSMKIFEEGLSPSEAMERSYTEVTGENVALMLSVTEPDVIHWCRLNFPMFVGMADHGVCMATVPLAFADMATGYSILPALSTGTVTKDGFTVKKMPDPPFTVAPITPGIWHTAYERIISQLQKGSRAFGVTFADEFEPADCTEKNVVTWAILSDLHRQGKLEMKKELLPGVREGLLKTKFNYIWKG